MALLAGAAAAQSTVVQAQKVPVIGFLHPGFPDSGSPVLDALREELRDAGYVEGETIKIEARWARGKPANFSDAMPAFFGAQGRTVFRSGLRIDERITAREKSMLPGKMN